MTTIFHVGKPFDSHSGNLCLKIVDCGFIVEPWFENEILKTNLKSNLSSSAVIFLFI